MTVKEALAQGLISEDMELDTPAIDAVSEAQEPVVDEAQEPVVDEIVTEQEPVETSSEHKTFMDLIDMFIADRDMSSEDLRAGLIDLGHDEQEVTDLLDSLANADVSYESELPVVEESGESLPAESDDGAPCESDDDTDNKIDLRNKDKDDDSSDDDKKSKEDKGSKPKNALASRIAKFGRFQ